MKIIIEINLDKVDFTESDGLSNQLLNLADSITTIGVENCAGKLVDRNGNTCGKVVLIP